MSYIGNTNTTQSFTPAVDYFSGNGSTTAFTLSRPVASVAQVEAVIDNVVQNPSSAYTVNANTITFTSAPLSGTNNIYVRYTSPITQVIAPGQGTVNTTALAGGTVTTTADATLNGLTVGKGGGADSASTAVGSGALATSGGSANTAVGQNALTANSSGVRNASFGRASLIANTSGTDNSAIGDGALAQNTTGSSNTAVGRASLASNSTASNNTAVGYQAGYSNQTGANNVFVGYSAGYNANTSGGHTFVGYNAGLNSNSSSTANTFFGNGAGSLVTSGIKNTIIGRYDGNTGGLDIRTASNYIVLSDGDGNPNAYINDVAEFSINAKSSASYSVLNFRVATVLKTQQYYETSTSRFIIQNSSAGVYLASGGTSWTSNSDERKKDIIEPITDAVNKVSTLRTVIGKYKTDVEGTRRSFLIAQDVQAVFPEAVDAQNPDDLGVQYSDVIPLLVASIKELKTIVDAQAAEIAELKAKVGV